MEHTSDNIKIRRLVPSDLDGVRDFFRALGEVGTAFFNANGYNERQACAFLQGERENHIYWAAVADTPDGQEIAGIVFLFKINTRVPWLGVAVAEKWQGRHLGCRLLTTAEEWARETGAGGIMLTTARDNTRAQGLYERMGYKNIGRYCNGELLYLLAFPSDGKDA